MSKNMLPKNSKSVILSLILFSMILGIPAILNAALEPKPGEHVPKMIVINKTPYQVWIDFIPDGKGNNAHVEFQGNGQKLPDGWIKGSNYIKYYLGYNPGRDAQLSPDRKVSYGTDIESLKAKIDGKEVIFYVKFNYKPGSELNQGEATATITSKTMS